MSDALEWDIPWEVADLLRRGQRTCSRYSHRSLRRWDRSRRTSLRLDFLGEGVSTLTRGMIVVFETL